MIGKTIAQYEILEQLGSGGMGVVYKATDTRLHRTVALKFLPPQFSSDETAKARFMQEARAASALDDPHICTIHDIAEADDGQLFIVMAFYDGSTLKYVLEERQLDIQEAAGIARQLSRGLNTAHEAGIVHRDIKPANIMVTARGLVKILDFGVAKLGQSSDLTREGSTIGTAAYMSPEQARGESVTSQSDIWSVGAVLYEMLTGTRPFGGGYEAAIAYSIINEDPTPAGELREDVPEELDDLVSRCMAKSTAERYTTMADVARDLAFFSGDSGTHTAVRPAIPRDSAAKGSLQHAALKFSVIAAVVLALLYAGMISLGLPGWVFPVGVLLILAGFPIVLYASAIERKRDALDTNERQKLTGVTSWLTTRKAFQGGVLALGSLVLATAGFVGLRMAGVGPFATLISGGELSRNDLVIVADFKNRTDDAGLGATVTEAFRIDLSQSTAIRLMDRSAVQSALLRMKVSPDTTLDKGLALIIAEREGAKAVIEGDIATLGASYTLNTYIISAADGSQLAAFREDARSDTDLVDAIDRLSARLREEIGESLVDIRGNEPLDHVTTASLAALRYYSEGERLSTLDREAEALEQVNLAIAEDSMFAMAYRKQAVLLGNTRAPQELRERAATKAFELRERLPLRERLLTEAYYASTVTDDDDAVVRAYEEVLRRYPYDLAALNNLALQYNGDGQYKEAEPLLRRALEVGEGSVFRSNLMVSLVAQNKLDEAWHEADEYEEALPGSDRPAAIRARLAFLQDDMETAEHWLDSMDVIADQEARRMVVANLRNDLLLAQGKIRAARAPRMKRIRFFLDQGQRVASPQPRDLDSLGAVMDAAFEEALLTGDPHEFDRIWSEGMKRVDELGGIPDDQDPYGFLALTQMSFGRAEEAQKWINAHNAYHERTKEEMSPTGLGRVVEAWVAANNGGDVDHSIATIENIASRIGNQRAYGDILGSLYEKAGNTDAAVREYTRFVSAPSLFAIGNDEGVVALIQFRLGALYEEKGDDDAAITWYTKMAERWKEADPVLQPQVAEAHRRIDALLDKKAREN